MVIGPQAGTPLLYGKSPFPLPLLPAPGSLSCSLACSISNKQKIILKKIKGGGAAEAGKWERVRGKEPSAELSFGLLPPSRHRQAESPGESGQVMSTRDPVMKETFWAL